MAASWCRCSELFLGRSRMLTAPPLNRSFIISTALRCQTVCIQHRWASGGRKGFLGEFVDSLKQEMNKNKEMKKNIQKFREEARRLEDSEALRQARRKYQRIESVTVKSSEVLKKTMRSLSETVKEGLEEAGRTDLGRKLRAGVEEAAKTARSSAQSVSKSSEVLERSSTFQTISQGMETVKREMVQGEPYRAPSRLRKRSELSFKKAENQARVFEVNEETTGVVLHKDSK